MRTRFHDDMSMDEVMRLWPAAIRVVLDHGLLCVGCPIAAFHTAADAVREHHIDGEPFLAALRAATEHDRA
jgi:hybrid cluster-associated redox disulfide protein